MTEFSIEQANWQTDATLLRQIRSKVFIDEQSVPIELEWDGKDDQASHWLAFKISQNEGLESSREPIATVRLLADGHVGRMAVLKEYRQQGVGKALLLAVLEHARQNQFFEVYLYAQSHAQGFYQHQGFHAYGEEFIEAGIPHIAMRLQIAAKRNLGLHGGDFAVTDYAAVTTSLIRQTTQQLRILSYELDPAVFDTKEIAEAVSSLARKSRYTDVKILLVNPQLAIKHGHRLVTLQRRLTAKITIKKVNCEAHEVKNNLIIADQSGIICQSIKEPSNTWANFNNKPVAINYISQFEELWQRAIIDNNLRQLEL